MDELARRLKVEPEELVQAMDSSIEVESLQKVICQGSSEGVSLMERVEQGHDEQEELLRRMLLEELLSSLEPRERRLIVLRFFYDRTQDPGGHGAWNVPGSGVQAGEKKSFPR